MTITSILLQFHLQISLISSIYLFSGCSHCLEIGSIYPFSGCSLCLEASQVVWNANWLTGFSVMDISFEWSSQAISKIIFFINSILLLLPVLRLALIFLIFMVYLLFSTLYCFSTLVCANLVAKRFGRFACFDLGSTFIKAVPWSLQVFLTILLLTGKTCIFKDASYIDPILWDSWNFQQPTFCFWFKA